MGQLYAITPFTQLDYPGELACIAWISGCNFRCAYCHNPDIVLKRGQKDDAELLSFLKSRKGLLTGVVFSGGEATFCPSLPELARQAKGMGYKIKLDTNGTNPGMVRELLDERLIDAVALDYKCPPHKAESLLGTPLYGNAFRETLAALIEESRAGRILLEIRTTFHPDFLDESDLGWIVGDLDQRGYRGTYWLQNIVTSGEKTLGNVSAPDKGLERPKLSEPQGFDIGYRNFSS